MFPIPFNFPFRKKDGSMTTISQAISEGGGSYTLPTASETTKGGVKVGVGLTMDGETLKNTNPTPYSLPTASAETLGGIKVGAGLSIEDGVLSASGGSSSVYNHYIKLINNSNSKIIAQFLLVTTSNTPITSGEALFDILGLEHNVYIMYSEISTTSTTIKFTTSGGQTQLSLVGSGYIFPFTQLNVNDSVI